MKEQLKAKNKSMTIKVSSGDAGYPRLEKYFKSHYGEQCTFSRPNISLATDIQTFRVLLNELPAVCVKAGPVLIRGTIETDDKNKTFFKYCLDAGGIFAAETTTSSQRELSC